MLALAAHAASTDPQLTWRTISTAHFDLHFHQGLERLADEHAAMVEDVFDEMTAEVAWVPRQRIQVTLLDRTDDANGFASSVPYNQITLYATAPTPDSTLGLYEDWARAIFTHELTHVLHLDANHGLVRVARAVVGKVAATNQVSPAWMVEGFATFQETRHTPGGRGRASWPDMIKRTAAVEDTFPPLGNLDGFQPRQPGGNLRYLFGQDFLQYVADHAGADVWTRWVHTYGSWWTPGFFLPTKRVFGRSLRSWYADWRRDELAGYAAQAARIRAEGETPVRVLSDTEATCSAPAFSPDGAHLVWSCYDLRTGSALWLADGEGYAPVKLRQDFGAGYVTWRADSAAFAYSANHVVNQFNTWDDVYLFDVATESVTALTVGARARDPEFSPDGSRLLYVTNRAQDNRLEAMTVDRRRTPLAAPDPAWGHVQLSTPRFSPDGAVLALSVWAAGRRDLWLYTPDGAPLRRLTDDVALDQDPVWSADGRWLYFVSDRDGVPNVYAIALATERLYRVTNVVTGAARPTVHPDGTRMAFQQYSSDGWDIVLADLDPAGFRDLGGLPAPLDGGPPLREHPRAPAAGAGALPDPTEPPPAPAEPPPARPEAPAPPAEPPPEPSEPSPPVPPAAPPPAPPEPPPAPPEAPPAPPGATSPGLDPEEAGRSVRLGADPFGGPRQVARGLARADLAAVVRRQSTEVVQTFADSRVEDAFGEEVDYPFRIAPHRYSPARTLLPTYVLPYFQTTPFPPSETFAFTCLGSFACRGLVGSLSTSGTDALRRYGWSAYASYRTDVDAGAASGSITVNRFLPVYSVGAYTSASPTTPLYTADPTALAPDGSLVVEETGAYYVERRASAYAVVSWPYRLRTTLFAQYAFTDQRPRYALPDDVYTPQLPLAGTTGAVSGGWRYSWSQPTPYAISPEDGRVFALVGSLFLPQLGTFVRDWDTGASVPTSLVQVTGELREYVVNPWVPNQVLALRAAGGVTFGATRFLGNYVLGGSYGDAGFSVTPDQFRMVRGYPLGADVGDLYWLAGVEYRLPLLRVERGLGTLPFYARTLSLSLVADAGNAFVDPALSGEARSLRNYGLAAIDAPLVGVGAELVFRTVVMYGVGLDGRLGYALSVRGDGLTPTVVAEDGRRVFSSAPLYLRLGGSF